MVPRSDPAGSRFSIRAVVGQLITLRAPRSHTTLLGLNAALAIRDRNVHRCCEQVRNLYFVRRPLHCAKPSVNSLRRRCHTGSSEHKAIRFSRGVRLRAGLGIHTNAIPVPGSTSLSPSLSISWSTGARVNARSASRHTSSNARTRRRPLPNLAPYGSNGHFPHRTCSNIINQWPNPAPTSPPLNSGDWAGTGNNGFTTGSDLPSRGPISRINLNCRVAG